GEDADAGTGRAVADDEAVRSAGDFRRVGLAVENGAELGQAGAPVDVGEAGRLGLALDGQGQRLVVVIGQADREGGLVDQDGPVGAVRRVAGLFGEDLVHGRGGGDHQAGLVCGGGQAVEAVGEFVLDVG